MLSWVYLGEVGVRQTRENLKGQRQEALSFYRKLVLFLPSPRSRAWVLCVIGGVGLAEWLGSWRRKARSRKAGAFHSLRILSWPKAERGCVRMRDGGKLGWAVRLSRVLGDADKGGWAQKLTLGKEGLFLMCVVSLNPWHLHVGVQMMFAQGKQKLQRWKWCVLCTEMRRINSLTFTASFSLAVFAWIGNSRRDISLQGAWGWILFVL